MSAQLSPIARFDHILLATDGSPVSTGAVRVALNLSSRCGARLTVMHMAKTDPSYAMFNPNGVLQTEDQGRAVLRQVEEQAGPPCGNCAPGLGCGGERVEELFGHAGGSQGPLVVMGRRGVHWLERLVLGEAAARVVGHVRCSVLVVPQQASFWERGILVAVDGSRYADMAAVAAGNLAKRCGLPLTVLAVCASDDLSCDLIKPLADRVRDLLRQDGVAADSLALEGRPADTIIQAARDNDCDLIVVGNQGRSGLERILMGSVSQQVVTHARCPVLVVKGA